MGLTEQLGHQELLVSAFEVDFVLKAGNYSQADDAL